MKTEQLIEFLTSSDRGLFQLSKVKAFSEIESLNEAHFDALIKHYDAGLRGDHLRALKLTYSYSPIERPFDFQDTEIISFLSSDGRGKRKLSPSNAALEINGLNYEQLIILSKCYDLGLRGQVLNETKWHTTHKFQIEALSFLIAEAREPHKLTFAQAFSELKSLTEIQVDALIKHYDAGLRGDHLRALKLTYSYINLQRPFGSEDNTIIKFLTSNERGDRKLSPKDAVLEINGLSSEQLLVLSKFYDSGLRGQVLYESQWHIIHKFQIKALSFLIAEAREPHKLTFAQAFSELKSLTEIQVDALIQYYDAGLRGRHLRQSQLPINVIKEILFFKKDSDRLNALWKFIISSLPTETIYLILDLAQNMAFTYAVILICSQVKQEALLKIALKEQSRLADFIFDHMLENGSEELFLRDKMHSLNSFLKQHIDSTKDNAFLVNRLGQLEHRQQTIIQRNAKQAMFGWAMPKIGVVITEERGAEDQPAPGFDDLLKKLQKLLPDSLKPDVQKLQKKLHDEDAASPKTPITKDETILKLLQTLNKAIARYHQGNPDPGTRRYLNWQEELQEIGSSCKEGKIAALSNMILSLEAPLVVYINHLLKTKASSMLQHRLAVHEGMHVHYPQAFVCALLGIHQSLEHADPYAFILTRHTLKTMASQVASALDRASFISAATPDIPDYFIKNIGKTVNVNSMDYRKHLDLFIYALKKYGLYHQLGFKGEASDVVIGSCLLGQRSDIEAFKTRLDTAAYDQVIDIRIREDLRVLLADQAEQLLVSVGILMAKTKLDALKYSIKTMMLRPIQDMDYALGANALWTGVLTKLNGVQLVMEILGQMSEKEFEALTIDAFLYKPPGMDSNLLQVIAGNPLFAEDIFSVKFMAEQNGPPENPVLLIHCKPYTADELLAPVGIKIRQLFAQFNKNSPVQMQHFFEEFYTKSGSLHFAIVQLNNNGETRKDITKLLIRYLASYSELFKTTDSLVQIVADFLININKLKHPKEYALMKTFLNERLGHLLEYNLLTAYFKTVSLMPDHALSEAPHHNSEFFTPDRVAFMKQQEVLLKPYFNQLDDAFNLAFQDACVRESSQSPLMNLSMFAQAMQSDSPMSQTPAP